MTTSASEPDRTTTPILWVDAEPDRLQRDLTEVADFAPHLMYCPPDPDSEIPHGGWKGELPRWPFNRPAPESLDELIGTAGLPVSVAYRAAYPMVPPLIYPLDPVPTLEERTQTTWHVAPGGSLCLLRSVGAWLPEASITELLAKAAGWRIEYALMKAAVIDQMSVNGIVSDPSHDHLILHAAHRMTDHDAESRDHGAN
ncbi:hypothetical protein [Nocardia mikamii]|uniref:hypothetical protein n=1 Tax=Nocardia mikamii TaxID=508464 RepID=UPI0007A50F56|nr:hypothetical protein [Nocardia mikamii]